MRPRREVRNSRISFFVSTQTSVSRSQSLGRPCQYLSQQGLPCARDPRFYALMTSTENKTWIITGAGRGMGVDIAKAALAAGHNVVATGRDPNAVAEALGASDDLLVAKLDVTSTQDADA